MEPSIRRRRSAQVQFQHLFHAERVVSPGSGPVEGEGAARAAVDGAVGGALARRVAPDEEVPDRMRGVEVETAACECETLTGQNLTELSTFYINSS